MNITPKRWIALGLMALGGIDLATGNTDKQLLPDFIANLLTQQIDAVLIGIGVLLWIT
jgi:hypothetical protein